MEPLSIPTGASASHPAGGTVPPGRPNAAAEAVFSDSCAAGSGTGIVGELFQRLGMVGIGTLVLTLVIFFTVPRRAVQAWRGALPSPKTTVGFSDTVRLGDLGEILESREEVIARKLTYGATNHPYPVQTELYLRGAALTHYDHGQWTSGRRVGPAEDLPSTYVEDEGIQDDDDQGNVPPGTGGTGVSPVLAPGHGQDSRSPRPDAPVCQSITIEPLDRNELFAIWPLVVGRGNDKLYYDVRGERLMRRRDRPVSLHVSTGDDGLFRR